MKHPDCLQVEKREKDCKKRSSILLIRVYLQNRPHLIRARKLLVERSKWCISRLMTITSQVREFQALSAIRGIPLLPVILNPSSYDLCKHHSESFYKLSRPLQQVLKSAYNGSQLEAISAAIGPFDPKKEFQLSLIQGPPGVLLLSISFYSLCYANFFSSVHCWTTSIRYGENQSDCSHCQCVACFLSSGHQEIIK